MENQTQKKTSIGVWEQTTKNGKTYFSFTIDGVKYSMWKNGFKTEKQHPDYLIYKQDEFTTKQTNE